MQNISTLIVLADYNPTYTSLLIHGPFPQAIEIKTVFHLPLLSGEDKNRRYTSTGLLNQLNALQAICGPPSGH